MCSGYSHLKDTVDAVNDAMRRRKKKRVAKNRKEKETVFIRRLPVDSRSENDMQAM